MDTPPPSDFSDLQKPLEHFRAKTKRLKIHPREMLLLWALSLHMIFLPWAIGGMQIWGQLTSLGFAVLAFILALVPRHYTEEHTGAKNSFHLFMWPRLRRFPIFWLGLTLLAYVTVQGLNPAWIYVQNYNGWWMQRIDYVGWLPSGVNVPFEHGGPWLAFIRYASAWLTVCAIWTGFTRRRTVQIFFIVIAGNGLALALFGVAQRLLGNGKLFWFWESPNPFFFSSFVYKNHAGAYLVLILSIACGLAAWYYLRGVRRLEKSSPAGLFAFFATCIAISVLVSYARGATLIMLVFLSVAVGGFVIYQLRAPPTARQPLVAIVLAIIFGLFLKTGLEALNAGEAWVRIGRGLAGEDTSLESRRIATKASLNMLKDSWHTGSGAGSFRFLFPAYQQYYPEIFSFNGKRLVWEHAHNDLVEFPVELGVPGLLLFLASIGYWMRQLIKSCFWENPLGVCVVAGAVLITGYAWWDFPFQCPAVLILWCALWPAVTLWTTFEELNLRG